MVHSSPSSGGTCFRHYDLVFGQNVQRVDLRGRAPWIHLHPCGRVQLFQSVLGHRKHLDIKHFAERLRQEALQANLPSTAIVKVVVQQVISSVEACNIARISYLDEDVAQALHRLLRNPKRPAGCTRKVLFSRCYRCQGRSKTRPLGRVKVASSCKVGLLDMRGSRASSAALQRPFYPEARSEDGVCFLRLCLRR